MHRRCRAGRRPDFVRSILASPTQSLNRFCVTAQSFVRSESPLPFGKGEMLNDSKILPSDRDDDFGIWLAQRYVDVEKRIRIYVSDTGKFRDSNYYQMVAEFKDSKVAGHYVDYMRGKKRYADKDIILQEITAKKLPHGEEISFNKIVGVIASTGESLPVNEFIFA